MNPLEGPHYTESPVDVQDIVGTWTAANTRGGLSLAGGRVVLTPEFLVFTPWDMDETRTWLVKGLSKAGFSYAADIDKLITASRLLEPVAIPLSAIVSVQLLNNAQVLRPPTVRLGLAEGAQFDLGVLHSPTTMNPSEKNNVAMQDFMGHLHDLIGKP